MTTETRERFAVIAGLPDREIPLDEAALLIAAEAEDDMDVSLYLRRLDRLAAGFDDDSRYVPRPGATAMGLVNYIHEDAGFSGNVTNYYDPDNSYLNRVIDLRQGIPITLALIHLAIGDRLDIPIHGISFPGHFLVRYGGDSDAIVDPFSGRELSRADCETLLQQIAGRRALLREEYFQPASHREILLRVLDNLKQIFWKNRAWDDSKACIDHQMLLSPDRAEFSVQLGAVYEMQGNIPLARHTYCEVIQTASDERSRQLAGKRLLTLEAGKRIH